MIPPILLTIQVGWFRIPIPVVLFWPLFGILWIILGIIVLAVLLGTGGSASSAGEIGMQAWRVLCALRGTHVDVDQSQVRVRVSII